MTDALARLLDGAFDYAGLFPPAKLPMEGAVDNYLRYRSGADAWILDRFICSSAQLNEFRDILLRRDPGEPVPVSVIGTSTTNWGEGLARDAEVMTRFVEHVGDKADLEAYEIKVPDHENLAEYLADLRAFNQVDVYCELPWGPQMADSVGMIAEQDWLGAKARTGGLDVSAFPSSEDLAIFLQQCVQLEVEFKLTAGLHHPVRSHRSEVNAKMHGFLNVLTATTLLVTHDLTTREAASILASEDPSAFVFTDKGLQFGEWEANLEDIEDTRDLFAGIGSCSVEEPIQDLKKLSLI
jgi:hypothetical protein